MDLATPYDVHTHKKVDKFIKRHSELSQRWPAIEAALKLNPFPQQGSDDIVHLKGQLFCNHRWREGDYRLLYEVYTNTRAVWVFDAGSRGQVYR